MGLKFCYSIACNDDLIWLLWPTDKIVSLITGSFSDYFPETGFHHFDLNILIEKSCSGFNFGLLCFCMLSFLLVTHAPKNRQKNLSFPANLILSYVLTVFVNASRIVVSITAQNHGMRFLPNLSKALLHQIVGVSTHLVFLVLIYLLAEKIVIKIYPNEKLA